MIQTFLLENWLVLTLVTLLIVYRKKLIWEPLSGGNGHVQMDEVAKALIMFSFMWGVWKEGTRTELDKRVFDDTYFLILVSAVFAIANIKVDLTQMLNKKEKQPPNP